MEFPAPRCSAKLRSPLTLTQIGILNVTAKTKELATQSKLPTPHQPSYQPRERTLMRDAEQFAEQDRKRKKKPKQKHCNSLVYTDERTKQDLAGKISAEDTPDRCRSY
jgi:molecular chaperone DnaK (HSP70)